MRVMSRRRRVFIKKSCWDAMRVRERKPSGFLRAQMVAPQLTGVHECDMCVWFSECFAFVSQTVNWCQVNSRILKNRKTSNLLPEGGRSHQLKPPQSVEDVNNQNTDTELKSQPQNRNQQQQKKKKIWTISLNPQKKKQVVPLERSRTQNRSSEL